MKPSTIASVQPLGYTPGMADLLDSMRRAIRESGMLPGHVADRAGLERSVVSRLLAGRGLTLDNAERIAAALGMRIELRKAGKARKGR